MKAQNFILVILIFAFLSGCGNKSGRSFDSDTKSSGIQSELSLPTITENKIETSPLKQISLDLTEPVFKDRMIIRKGTMSLETEKFDESEKAITGLAAGLNGYITNSGSSTNTSGKKQGTIEARIPSKNFDAFISEAGKTGKVMSLNVTGNDITEEFIDIDARCKTQKALEDRLIKLLDEKAAKLTDVVEVEEKLAGVRAKIESMEGRMRYLKSQSEFSTLTISIFEPSLLQTSTGGGFFYEIEEAIKKGINGFTDVLTGLITFVIAFSPVLLIGSLMLLLIRKYIRNRKIKKADIPLTA
jgi:hypothetical protein